MGRVLVSHSPLALPNLSLAGFQSQALWGLVFLVQVPWPGEHDVGLVSLTPQGSSTVVISLPFVGCCTKCVRSD